MTTTRPTRWVRAGVLLALLAFWLIELRHLAVVPRAYEDEAWIASASWKLATTGVFGTDIQGDFFGMSHHYYGFLPLYPLMQALEFRLAGLGLWQARLTSVYLGLLVLALTFALGRRLFGPATGLLALGGLLLARTAGLTIYRPTGILLVDMARLGRYDIAVPVFGLAACLALGRAPLTGSGRMWLFAALAGALGGLAGLSHAYGWFWLAALGVAILYTSARRRDGRWALQVGGALVLGAALVSAPYVIYVLTAWASFVGQMGEYTDRMALFNLSWYAANLLAEPQRYGPGLAQSGWVRPGLWLIALVAPVAVLVMIRRARRSLLAAAAAGALVLLPALLALLITSKVANYLLLYLPVAAVAVAGTLVQAWQAARLRRGRWLRAGLLLLCIAVAAEGVSQWQRPNQAAATTTPFGTYLGRVRAAVNAVAPAPTVLGLHTYWFGFSDVPFTTWYYPLARARTPVAGGQAPVGVTLAQLSPTVVLVDARMRAFLSAPDAGQPPVADINAWLAAGYALTASVDDATYGRMDVYRRLADVIP